MRRLGLSPVALWVGRCWLAVAGFVMAVAATARPGLLPLGEPGHRLQLDVPAWVLFALLAALFAAFLAVLSVLISAPRGKDPDDFILEVRPPPKLSPLALMVLLLLPIIAIVGGVLLFHVLGSHGSVGARNLPAAISAPLPPQPAAPERAPVEVGAINWSLTLILGTLAVIVIGCALLITLANEPWTAIAERFRFRRRRRKALARELATAVSAGMRDLMDGDDPRRAVIACYRRCEATLASRRRRRYPSETPREFVADALATLQLPPSAIRSLLSVFERARFSNLAITSADRDTALTALDEIRSALQEQAQDGTAI